MPGTAEHQSEHSADPTPASTRRRIWDFTNHGTVGQVVGGLILAGVLGGIGGLWALMSHDGDDKPSTPKQGAAQGSKVTSPGTPQSGNAAPSGRQPSYTGWLIIGYSYKDLDATIPTDGDGHLNDTIGDVRYLRPGSPPALNGGTGLVVGIGGQVAPYSETGTPTAERCDQIAQANGTPGLEVTVGQWVCIRSRQGSVAALRIVEISSGTTVAVHSDATVWRHA